MNTKLNNAFTTVLESLGFVRCDTGNTKGYRRFKLDVIQSEKIEAMVNVTIFTHKDSLGYLVSSYVFDEDETISITKATDCDTIFEVFKLVADSKCLIEKCYSR